MLICEAAWGADSLTWQKTTLPIMMITIFMVLSHCCPSVSQYGVVSYSCVCLNLHLKCMNYADFFVLLHLTLSSIKSINHPIRWSQWPVIFPHTHTNTAWKTAAEQLVRNWWGRLDITCFFCFYGGFRRDKKGQNPPTPSPPLWIMLFCWLWGSLMKLLFSILWQKCFFPLLFNSGSVRGHLSCSLREISVTSVLHLS